MTAAELARQLGWYRSNLSGMDAGRRSVSLRTLAKLSRLLGCSPGDLLEVSWIPERQVFTRTELNARLKERESRNLNGLEKGWVHSVHLAWLRHYQAVRHSQ
ncbi:MAG: helix-turn-helix transcriptional regulator [Candidatus Omnitrophica bacterium]|nr:helix-turn-helix transcriptional regulator [Candidatus Omnitrophota bacterium]